MRLAVFFLVLVALAACGSYAGSDGLLGWNPARRQQVMMDTAAILQGMARAHVEKAEAAACNSATGPQSDRASPCR
jgi:hypothetical protein